MPARVSRFVLSIFAPSRLPYVVPAAVLILVAFGLLYSLVEGPRVSAWDGIWWVASTVTTVGYGDEIPHNAAGRLVAMAVMIFGIGFLFLMTGAIVERFISREVLRDVSGIVAPEQEILRQLRRMEGRMEAMEHQLRQLGGESP